MSQTSQGWGWWQATDGRWYPPERHPEYRPLPEPPEAATAQNDRLKAGGAILALAGGGVVLGAFLPWVKGTVPFAGTISRSGVDDGGDGVLLAAMGALLLLAGGWSVALKLPKAAQILTVLLAIATLALVALEFRRFGQWREDLAPDLREIAVRGPGLYLAGGAALGALLGATLVSAVGGAAMRTLSIAGLVLIIAGSVFVEVRDNSTTSDAEWCQSRAEDEADRLGLDDTPYGWEFLVATCRKDLRSGELKR